MVKPDALIPGLQFVDEYRLTPPMAFLYSLLLERSHTAQELRDRTTYSLVFIHQTLRKLEVRGIVTILRSQGVDKNGRTRKVLTFAALVPDEDGSSCTVE